MIRPLLLALTMAGSAFASVADDLRAFEGLRLQAYLDTTSHWTVGYGRRCDKGAVMTKEQAGSALADDIAKAEQGARRVFPSYDSQPSNVQDALTMTVFQLGASGCTKFIRFNQALESRDYKRAASEMLASRWNKQTTARAEAVARKLAAP